MALETATFISDLVPANPTATDPKSEGDDQIRLVKATVKNTFPNIAGAVTPTHTQLNVLAGVSANGLVARTAAGTGTARTLTAGAGITVTNGDGVSGNPTIAVTALDLPNSSAVVNYTPAGTGAVTTTVQSKLREFVSVKDFGAVGDGVFDDTVAIQNALNASASIYFPAGIYKTTSPLTTGAKRLYGETQSLSVIKVSHSGVGLNIVNTDLYGFAVHDLAIEGNGSSTAIVIESTTEVTSHAHFESLRIVNHAYGIRGASTFTLFDSYLEKVDFIICSVYGLQLSGSQNTLVACTFRLCGWGVLVDAPSGFSIGGASFDGGVFIGNNYDIVTTTTTVRPLAFRNVWFEQTTTLTFGKLTGVSEVFFQSLIFDGCLFQPAATAAGNGVIDDYNYKGIASFRNCIVFADLYASGTLPNESLGLGDANMVLSRTSCAVINGGGTVTPLKDYTTNSKVNLYNVYDQRKYATDAAAGLGGLTVGDLYYNTSTASVSIKN